MENARSISLIVPFYNEALNLEEFYEKAYRAVEKLALSCEILFIDDGSQDGGEEIVRRISEKDPRVKLVQLSRNFGQTAAISAGIKYATGEVIIPLDADNQNDPDDIPRLLAKINEGFDVVSGWRRDRRDRWLTRILPSRIANWLISWVTGVRLNDYGCTLKAYRSHYLKLVNLYGEMHRFIPAYASLAGAKITEIVVSHRERSRGQSKYGLSRTFKVLLDLLTIKFLGAFSTKPLYLFGGLGFGLLFISFALTAWVLVDKIVKHVFVHRNPMLLLAVFFAMVGIMLIMMGLLAELLVRIYHESQGKPPFLVKKTLNIRES